MWNTIVSDLHASLRSALDALVVMAQENPAMMGIAVVVGLLALMFAAEVADGRATTARRDEVPPSRLKRQG